MFLTRARPASSCRPHHARLLRGIFRKRRELLLDLLRCAAEALAEYMRIRVGPDTRPGIVVSIATSGISEELARKLFAWRHPGFSAHVGEAIPFEDKKAIEDVACYMVRAPLSLKKLVYLDGQKAVLYRSRMNPFLGRNFEAMDPLEWLARLADHIPDTGKHRTHFYGFYASRVRASRREKEGSELPVEAAPTKRRCPPSCARLISKVYRRTRSCAKAAQVRSRSWRTSPTSCPSGASWTIWA